MIEKRTPIAFGKAVQKVMNYADRGKIESVSLENAYGRSLAEDLVADHDVPSFDRSPYDGFAIRSEDTVLTTRTSPASLEVIGEIGAGSVFQGMVGRNQAVRIMTGAQIPSGADAVVMLELTKEYTAAGKKLIEIKRTFKSGDNISFRGEDTRKGATLAAKGSFITPGVVALLATFGYQEVPVAKKPVVGVLATGSELLEVNELLQPGKIRNSNSYMILSQIERAGGEAIYFGKFSDDLDQCVHAVENALSQVDILITTGGVSVGDYDYLPAIYERLGAEVLFNKIAMRPGSVTTVAALHQKLLFGLSGNPSACFVGFELFVRPIIRYNNFHRFPHMRKEKAFLGQDFLKANPFTRFVRASLHFDEGRLIALPSGFDKSSAVSSLAEANSLIILPGGTRGYESGMMVDVLLLDDQKGCEWPWENIVAFYK